ncbi:prepilin-type N-terminal cleavage/methylation domain-containing protein [Halalkalibacter nanhaiisediminis]|uniref:Prepilin-type N-terminal cleavage/methylation domain-containing protein n=1 Tax=Halalkalibacter nanhaiisediminis TaxID=688079 RepID=A0A562QLM4_9BACI|nr:prepilin-type N-terminal cleavage/methylation domain-containing protein [Halalkalibacter nanhaiisediminis]TWI57090.1 prepilin-type N-terminal cleavage/methylation domain-containing protein [Halalkalibacter nanhaiisediminis]
MKQYLSKENGLTLLELLVSLVIISIVLTSFFTFFSQGMIFSVKNEENLLAADTAREILVLLETEYQPIEQSNQYTLSCHDSILTSLNNFDSSTCTVERGNHSFFLETTVHKEKEFELYQLHVKLFDNNNKATLLTETHGYVLAP